MPVKDFWLTFLKFSFKKSLVFTLMRRNYLSTNSFQVLDMETEKMCALKEFVYDNIVNALVTTLNKLNLTTEKEKQSTDKDKVLTYFSS